MTQPTICLNMILRDEENVIRATLENIVSVVPITTWVINDTGSIDRTKEVVEGFFRERSIPGRIISRTWENFGANRQYALEDAQGAADYVFFFDADCRLEGQFPALNRDVDSYYILSRRSGTSYPVKHLVRNDGRFRWRGVVHEGLYFSGENETSQLLPGITVLNNSSGARSRDQSTYYRDARALVSAIENITPQDHDLLPRYAFYAANSFRDARCPREAVEWYRKRIAFGGWPDEVYVSYLNMGVELKQIGEVNAALDAWLAGSEVCPDRAECLYKAAQAERERGRFNIAAIYAQAAMNIPAPDEGRLFVWRDVYRYWAAFELLWSLKHLGRSAEGGRAFQRMKEESAPPHLFQMVS